MRPQPPFNFLQVLERSYNKSPNIILALGLKDLGLKRVLAGDWFHHGETVSRFCHQSIPREFSVQYIYIFISNMFTGNVMDYIVITLTFIADKSPISSQFPSTHRPRNTSPPPANFVLVPACVCLFLSPPLPKECISEKLQYRGRKRGKKVALVYCKAQESCQGLCQKLHVHVP